MQLITSHKNGLYIVLLTVFSLIFTLQAVHAQNSNTPLIAYLEVKPGSTTPITFDLWVLDSNDANNPRNLTNGQYAVKSFAWSPNGQKLAFTSALKNESGYFVVDSSGQNIVKLPSDLNQYRAFAWSPDSLQIAIAQGANKINLVDIAAQQAKSIDVPSEINDKPITSISWSPDGAWLAFTADKKLYLVQLAAGKVARLTRKNEVVYFPQWMPNSKQLFFSLEPTTKQYGVVLPLIPTVMDIETKARLELPTQQNSISEWYLSPDGNYFASNDQHYINVTEVGTGKTYFATRSHPGVALYSVFDQDVRYTPDGTHILYVSTDPDGFKRLYKVDVKGQETPTAILQGEIYSAQWQPDGQLRQPAQALVIPALTPIPEVAPGTSQIAFGKDDQIWLMNADGTSPRQLTEDGRNANPVWSPDGRQIAFINYEVDRQIFIMDADGQNLHPLNATIQKIRFLTWLVDNTIVFGGFGATTDQYEIHAIHADGTGEKILLKSQKMVVIEGKGPEPKTVVLADIYTQQLSILNIETGDRKPLTISEYADIPVWSRDNRYVYFYDRNSFSIVSMEIATKKQVELTGPLNIFALVLSEDDKHLIYVGRDGMVIMNTDGSQVKALGLGVSPAWQPRALLGSSSNPAEISSEPTAELSPTVTTAPTLIPASTITPSVTPTATAKPPEPTQTPTATAAPSTATIAAASDSNTLIQIGQRALDNNDYAAAVESFTKVLTSEPDNADALLGLGLAQGGTKNFADAKASLERYLTLKRKAPDQLTAVRMLYVIERAENTIIADCQPGEKLQDLNNAGVVAISQRDYPGALASLFCAVFVTSDFVPYHNLFAAYNAYGTSFWNTDWDRAIKYIERAYLIAPDDSTIAQNLSSTLNNAALAKVRQLAKSGSIDPAAAEPLIQDYKRSIELNANNPSPFLNLASLLLNIQRYRESLQYYRQFRDMGGYSTVNGDIVQRVKNTIVMLEARESAGTLDEKTPLTSPPAVPEPPTPISTIPASTAAATNANESNGEIGAGDSSPSACPGVPPSRLKIGDTAKVAPGNPNNVRSQPTRNALKMTQIPSGGIMTLLDGPVCADGYAWWQVDYKGIIGWTPEGDSETYWLVPVASAASNAGKTTATPASSASSCRVTTNSITNLRRGPGTSYKSVGQVGAGQTYTVIGYNNSSAGFTWWKLDNNNWIRSDVVDQSGDCSSVPKVR